VHTARIGLFVLAPVACLALGAWQFHVLRNQHRLDEVASSIAGRKVSVHCPNRVTAALDQTPEDGYVLFYNGVPQDYTEVKRYVCEGVLRFAHGGRDGTAARALLVLVHESWHMHGVMDEAVTECNALQTLPRVAQDLGATPQEAAAVARYDLDMIDPLLPGEYHSPECRDGGRLDLRPGDSTWP
jgi:hypothetical protein